MLVRRSRDVAPGERLRQEPAGPVLLLGGQITPREEQQASLLEACRSSRIGPAAAADDRLDGVEDRREMLEPGAKANLVRRHPRGQRQVVLDVRRFCAGSFTLKQ